MQSAKIISKSEEEIETEPTRAFQTLEEKVDILSEKLEISDEEDEMNEIEVISTDDSKIKRHYCLFCGLEKTAILRHIQHSHKHEKEVKELLVAKKTNNEENLKKATHIKLRGNYNHNMKVIKEKRGCFVVTRRPTVKSKESVKFSDFTPCPHCFAFVTNHMLSRHKKRCIFFNEDMEPKSERYFLHFIFM